MFSLHFLHDARPLLAYSTLYSLSSCESAIVDFFFLIKQNYTNSPRAEQLSSGDEEPQQSTHWRREARVPAERRVTWRVLTPSLFPTAPAALSSGKTTALNSQSQSHSSRVRYERVKVTVCCTCIHLKVWFLRFRHWNLEFSLWSRACDAWCATCAADNIGNKEAISFL